MQLTKVNCPEYQMKLKCPYPMNPTRIVVHNTYNDASAMAEISYMLGNDNEVSFHYAVDDYRIVQGIEENKNCWHAGDGSKGKGNREGIAIEICYSKSGGERFRKAEKNAVELIVDILQRYGWGIEQVTKHQDYMDKYCPHRTLDMGWNRFLKMILDRLNCNLTINQNAETTGIITYQAYDGIWLPEVYKCDNTDEGYAGRYGKAISGLKGKCEHGELLIQSHILGAPDNEWLEAISSKDYNEKHSNSYSGILNKSIDCTKVWSTVGWVKFRTHIKEKKDKNGKIIVKGRWLPWVDSRTKTGSESYAGIYGYEMDGVQMY